MWAKCGQEAKRFIKQSPKTLAPLVQHMLYYKYKVKNSSPPTARRHKMLNNKLNQIFNRATELGVNLHANKSEMDVILPDMLEQGLEKDDTNYSIEIGSKNGRPWSIEVSGLTPECWMTDGELDWVELPETFAGGLFLVEDGFGGYREVF